MPIFAWRRIRSMLADVSDIFPESKLDDLAARLESREVNSVLAAEAELAIVWAASRVSKVQPEPENLVPGNRPDLYAQGLLPDRPIIIEIRALSDDSFSGREAMERTANIISGFVDRIEHDAGAHLQYEFDQHSGYKDGKFFRRRCIDPSFTLNQSIRNELKAWITNYTADTRPPLYLTSGVTRVAIRWNAKRVHREGRTFCRMPPVAYDLEENPIYVALRKKRKQVRARNSNAVRCIALFDAGCDLLRRHQPTLGGMREIPGSEIILHFLRKSTSVDLVLVLTPKRQGINFLGGPRSLYWSAGIYTRGEPMADAYYAKIQRMVAYLPAPAVEGYQARSLLRQGSFEPGDNFSRSNTEVSSGGAGGMTIRVSKKAIFDLLCGNISQQEFQNSIFGAQNANLFKLAYNRGETIQAVELKQGGLDVDDDKIEFAIDIDWDRVKIRSSIPASRFSRLLIAIKHSRACKKIKNWIDAFRRFWGRGRDS